MGIRGLWSILEAAQESRSLLDFAVAESFQPNSRNRSLVIGVDISIWLDSFTAAFHRGLHTQHGENPELRGLFYRLCEFLKTPVTLVFVFDGPSRPQIKRNRHVKTKPLWIVQRAKELIEAFGFYCHDAPGEAEAELAKLNSSGYLDAIITSDSDAFVFGAQCVIRLGNTFKVRDDVRIYMSHAIENVAEVALTPGGMLLMALMTGGDYHDGIQGCGITSAHALARCGFGDSLLDSARNLSRPQFVIFLEGWRRALQDELLSNSHGYLTCYGSRHRKLAGEINDYFPDMRVLELYVHPETTAIVPSGSHRYGWLPHESSIKRITTFCANRFGWSEVGDGNNVEVLTKFQRILWEGIAFRMLCFVSLFLYILKARMI
ncbi:PIN domain-like protein [Lyophyllum atratum]|nr:PIN domain-like protein [Lyophyllum atratum]